MGAHHHQPIRVVLADYLEMTRSGLKHWLEQEPDILVVAEASSGKELIEILRHIECDIVLMDLFLPDISGIKAIQMIRKEGFGAKVVALNTQHTNLALRVLKAGANAYLLKEEKKEVHITAIKKVMENLDCSWISPMANQQLKDTEQELNSIALTPTELKVLSLINNDTLTIASILNLAVGTVRNHISNVYFRLDVKSRIDAIRVAQRLGLLGD